VGFSTHSLLVPPVFTKINYSLLDKSEIPFNPPSPHSVHVSNKGKKNKLNYLCFFKKPQVER
jgi:hypothetical protein